MSEHEATFVDLCIQGKVLSDEIDDFVESWHESDSGKTLHDFLGMTWKEYAAWVDSPWMLPYIIAAHRQSISLEAVLDQSEEMKLAARASDAERAWALIDWLREQGKLA